MRRTREIAEHHAEAVVKRDRNTHTVAFGIAQRFANKEAVVQDVVMRQCCAFWKASCSRRVLDIDWIVELERAFQRIQIAEWRTLAVTQKWFPVCIDNDRLAQTWAPSADLIEHRHVVRGAETPRQ